MKIAGIEASILNIPFRESFKHASAERMQTQTLWVKVLSTDGQSGTGEGCPREYVTGESLSSAMLFVQQHRADWMASVDGLEALRAWLRRHREDVDRNPAAWCAVEMALLDIIARSLDCSVESLLGLPPLEGSFCYTAVIGDAAPPAFQAQLQRYQKAGFRQFKLKLSGEADVDQGKVAALRAAGIDAHQVRVDANNLWPSAEIAIAHMRRLDYPFMALEEPLQAGDMQALTRVAQALGMRIILDESLLRAEQLSDFAEHPEYWIANLRVSKMGGVLRSLELLAAIRRAGLGLIVGAHVGETSLLTRAALTVAATARDILIGQEGAFGTHLLMHDVVDTPLMFGHGGILAVEHNAYATEQGWGLRLVS